MAKRKNAPAPRIAEDNPNRPLSAEEWDRLRADWERHAAPSDQALAAIRIVLAVGTHRMTPDEADVALAALFDEEMSP